MINVLILNNGDLLDKEDLLILEEKYLHKRGEL